MTYSKRLYFIPIIARAVQSGDPGHAMKKAFDEIWNMGKQEEYKDGFRQFLEFTKTSLKPSEENSEIKAQIIRDAIHGLINDLATDTFEGDEEQKSIIMKALKNTPEWNAEYEQIREEVEAISVSEIKIKIEILKGDQVLGSVPLSPAPASIGNVTPDKYIIRFSNGRMLWEGDLMKEDLIWSFAFPEEDLKMAAATEVFQKRPTRTISLLDGEIAIYIFAGIETGQIRIERAK